MDDMMCVGDKEELNNLLVQIEEKYQWTSTMLGPGPDEARHGKFLNRKVEWTHEGLTWTGDQRLVDEILEGWQMSEARFVDTPGTKD